MANTLPTSTPEAAINLAKIAYIDETEDGNPQQKTDITTALSNLDSSIQGPWSLVWGPSAIGGNLAYVALNSTNDLYAVVLRGTVSSESWALFDNLEQDADAITQVNWLYPQNSNGLQVSSGFFEALKNIIVVPDPTTDTTLMDFLRQTFNTNYNAQLLVTGHSLGAALVTMVATWLYDQLPKGGGPSNVSITPITFAAPTAGNQAFATYYDSIFLTSQRYVNTLDLVPMGYADLATLVTEYASPGPSLKSYNLAVYEALWFAAPVFAKNYSQTNQTNGTVSFQGPAPVSTNTFPTEVEVQHSTDTYISYFTNAASSAAAGK